MGIGPLVRRSFGRHEQLISELYRRFFVDLDEFVSSIRTHIRAPSTILEIGCGDGMVTERIVHTFPDATVTGVDICAQPGRLYRGERSRVRFVRTTAQDLAAAEPAHYHLVIIADVLHHVPYPEWADFLSAAHRLMAGGGTLVLKDWVRQRTFAYLLGYLSDRYVTGERIRYPHESELRTLAQNTFGANSIKSDFRIKPWNCNLALVIAPYSTCATPGNIELPWDRPRRVTE
ncbi:MAG: class I SAM-dependent methyltransferase [Steroidobacteraceae bacterium]